LRAAVRQRPDYVIVGEVRGSEAYTLFQAMAVGHGGLGSIHAESVLGMINRLETQPMNIPRALIPTLNAVAIINRTRVGNRPARRMITLSEIKPFDPNLNRIEISELYKWEPSRDTYSMVNASHMVQKIKDKTGMDQETVDLELAQRTVVLKWMVKSGIRQHREVAAMIRNYYNDPEATYNKARVELVE